MWNDPSAENPGDLKAARRTRHRNEIRLGFRSRSPRKLDAASRHNGSRSALYLDSNNRNQSIAYERLQACQLVFLMPA